MWFIIGHVFVTVSNYPTFIFSPSKLEADSGGVFFKKQTTVTVLQTTSLLCSLSFWRLAVHYCHLMSSKSITSLHSVFLFFYRPCTVEMLCLLHNFWFMCSARFVWPFLFFFSRKNEYKSRERDCGNSFFPPFNWFFYFYSLLRHIGHATFLLRAMSNCPKAKLHWCNYLLPRLP